jgi:signal transduction histidine kinase/DNA-binding response OmpR family regulator
MLHYILYAAFLLLGLGLAYFISKNKLSAWIIALNNLLNQFKPGKSIRLTAEYLALPKELKPIADKVESLIGQEPTKAKANPEEIGEGQEETRDKKQLNNMMIINELGQKVTSSLHLEETFQHLFTTLNSMMDAAVVELGVYDSNKEKWVIYSNLESKSTTGYRNHVAEWVQANNRVVDLENAELDFGRYVNEPLTVQSGEQAASILSFPILFNDEVEGTITVVSFRKNAFDEYHKESIEHLLGFLSVALQNAHTHEQVNLLKIRAEESEKHEQQFLANMSHEIRTPMNAVLGMTNLLLDTHLSEKQTKYLKAINTSSKNLLVIINDILDLSKLEAGKMEIEKIPFQIKEVIQNVSDTSKFKAEEKGLRFEINVSPDLPEVVKGDPTRLNQILTNLCSNAVKFTEQGSINISVDKPENSHFIQFRVIDTGIGIPKDKQHLLFGNFKQVDSSTFRKYGGTGLGLAISKTLIELQGGKVNVVSEPGVGSEFSVQIPYEIGTEEEANALHHEVADVSGLHGLRVLIAEDNEYNQIVVNDTLDSLIEDVHIDIAENGLIAVDMVKANNYHLVLMDAQMPEMDGLDATRTIRKLPDPEKSKMPIIALTASVHKADIDKCLNSGMNAFVPKPFTREELLGAIADFYHNTEELKPGNSKKKEAVLKKAKKTPNLETAATEQVTDMTFLKDFTEGNADRMKKYIGLYLKLLPDNIEKMEKATSLEDHDSLVSIMHAMRPHLNYMGMKEAAQLAADIELFVQNQEHFDKIATMLQTVKSHCVLSKRELETELEILA